MWQRIALVFLGIVSMVVGAKVPGTGGILTPTGAGLIMWAAPPPGGRKRRASDDDDEGGSRGAL